MLLVDHRSHEDKEAVWEDQTGQGDDWPTALTCKSLSLAVQVYLEGLL